MKIALWTFLGTLGLALVAVVLNFVGVFAFQSGDGWQIGKQIASELSAKTGAHVTVTCPNKIPEKRGGIEDCEANAGRGTTLVRLVQDDSRGHFHYDVNDEAVLLPSPDSSPSASPEAVFGEACVGFGASGSQCACLYGQLIDHGRSEDVLRAADSYRRGDGLPDDLAYAADACRTGA